MTAYVMRRLALMLPVAFLVTIGVFLLAHLTPGDPALILLGEDRNPEAIAAIHHRLGLDQPLYVQYVTWLGQIVHLDLGRSVTTHQPVAIAIGERLPATFELGAVALIWSLLVAIPLGTIAAVRRGSLIDRLATGFTVGGVSIPNFVIGIVLIFVLSVSLRLFPFGGYVPFNKDAYENLRHIVLPAIALGTAGAAINMRFTRSSMIEVLNLDYIRTARAKGASWQRVVFIHALKNALIPVVTIIGLQIGGIIEGAVVTETVFTWPGVGRLAVESILNKDYTVVQGIVLVAAFSFMFANLLVDLVYGWLDPRISYA
jgi:peptide/nickel transport system permease protein